jgi:hypothetical protein
MTPYHLFFHYIWARDGPVMGSLWARDGFIGSLVKAFCILGLLQGPVGAHFGPMTGSLWAHGGLMFGALTNEFGAHVWALSGQTMAVEHTLIVIVDHCETKKM